MDIFDAVKKGSIDSIKSYIQNKGDVNAKDNDGYSLLNMAAIFGQNEIFNLLKKSGAVSDIFVESAVGNLEAVMNFINNGADVNASNSHGHKALMTAAYQGHSEIIKALINAKADINAKHEYSGNTALIGACYQGHIEVIKILIEAKANVNAKNNENLTALDLAEMQDRKDIIDLLKANGAKHQGCNCQCQCNQE